MKCAATTSSNKRCKCKAVYSKLCHTHIRMYYSDQITKIQSVWRSYLTRRRLKVLFIGLPRELQNLVLYFMRKDHRISQLHKSYLTVYKNKIHNMGLSLSYLSYHYQTLYTMEYPEYLEWKIKITDKIKYLEKRISEIV